MEINNSNQIRQESTGTVQSDTTNTPSSGSIKIVEIKDMNTNKDNTSGTTKVSEKDAKETVDKINKFLQGENTHAEYAIHEGFKDIMIKIVDNDTKQVIREIPPKKVLDMVQKLCEMVGIMFDKKI